MLEVINIKKVYQTKGGLPVEALNGVSIKFPEKGLVFLLGKSGSGKSTLLNVIGGLDHADEGEIVVKGKSSAEFTQADFDSYRNTYVGFIFQEFNILEEFTIEENIALALELQSKPSDKQAVNELLELVDLKGLGNRKPNTLSGGQRQRVAIARALIKNPELIMADEPTGALDTKTGEQILDILHKLSRDKLVLVVSHDREAAEKYGDRIIEIADGKVISDKTKELTRAKSISDNVDLLGEDVITIKNGKNITEKDVQDIVRLIKESDGESIITLGKKDVPEVKRVCRIIEDRRESFKKTKQENLGKYDGKEPTLIKSRLPLKQAFKMGLSGLKAKPIRFIFTVFLSVIAFCMFGVLSTLMLYDSNYSLAKSLEESNYQSVTIDKQYNYTLRNVLIHEDGTESLESESVKYRGTLFSQADLDELNKNNVGLSYAGVFTFKPGNNNGNMFELPVTIKDVSLKEFDKHSNYFSVRELQGFSDCGAEYMQNNGFTLLAGKYPEDSSGVAISEYLFDYYKYSRSIDSPSMTAEDFINGNRVLSFTVKDTGLSGTLKITGIYKVSDLSKYEAIKDFENNSLSNTERANLSTELRNIIINSFDTVAFVNPSFYEDHKSNINQTSTQLKTVVGRGLYMGTTPPLSTGAGHYDFFPQTTYEYNKSKFFIYNLSGEPMEYVPNDTEVILHKNVYEQLVKTKGGSLDNITEELVEELSKTVYYVVRSEGLQYSKTTELKVVGYYELEKNVSNFDTPFLVTTNFLYSFANVNEYEESREISEYVEPLDGKYNFVITNTKNTVEQVKHMISSKNGADFNMRNEAYDTLFNGAIIKTIKQLQTIFLVGGFVMGIFAALMLLNFISSSISAKRKEIGILRAVGAGKSDVFKIFFTESLLLAVICFMLASVVAWGASMILNAELVKIFSTQLLEYGFVNVLLILVISMFISFAATLFPVIREAKKSPVEGIRSL